MLVKIDLDSIKENFILLDKKEKPRNSELHINSIENVYLEYCGINGQTYRSTIF